MTVHQVIAIQAEAPAKPAWGEACNGCGICCLAEPCPLGVLLTRRRKGACVALVWAAEERRYRCGALGHALAAKVHGAPWWVLARAWLRQLRARLLARWIAAGTGCDCALERLASPTMQPEPRQHPKPPHD